MSTYPHAARPDCTKLDWLSDPSPPLAAAAIDHIAQEATRILTETLSQLESERSVTP